MANVLFLCFFLIILIVYNSLFHVQCSVTYKMDNLKNQI